MAACSLELIGWTSYTKVGIQRVWGVLLLVHEESISPESIKLRAIQRNMKLDPAHAILQAVRLAIDANIPALQSLVASHAGILKVELVLRILLTYLPESTDPASYTGFLRDVAYDTLSPLDAADERPGSTPELSDAEARRQVRKLHLLKLTKYSDAHGTFDDPLTSFLLDRAHQIDSETGTLPVVQELLKPFLGHSAYLRTWAISRLLPLLRLDYEYYPNRAPQYSLKTFEALDGSGAVSTLLSEALQQGNKHHDIDLARDLRGLIGPWMYGHSRKRRKLNTIGNGYIKGLTISDAQAQGTEDGVASAGWIYVYDWLLELSARDFEQATKAFEQWDGPQDIDYDDWGNSAAEVNGDQVIERTISYAQSGLAMIYSTDSTSSQVLKESSRIINRITELLDLHIELNLQIEDPNCSSSKVSAGYINSLSLAHLLHNDLLRSSNPLTHPTNESIELASLIVFSTQVFHSFGFLQPPKDALVTAIFGALADQRDVLRKTLHALRERHGKSRDETAWKRFRKQLIWLHDWGFSDLPQAEDVKQSLGVFCQIDVEELEIEFLKILLLEGRMLYYSLHSHGVQC